MIRKYLLILFIFITNILYAQTCSLGQNLVKGGSFENDFDLNEWSIISGDATPRLQKYSSGWAGTPPNGAGEAFLYARGESVTLKQSIDLSNCNFTEDYNYDFSVYLGGYGDGDTARVQVILKDENGNVIDEYDTDYQSSYHQMNKFSHAFAYSNNIKEADIIIKIDNNYFNWWDNDADGYVDLVNFKVVKTQYLEGFQDFNIINSLESRFIRGNFAIAGNTVMCLTDKTDGFNGNCQDDTAKYKTSNLRVSKYLDIDSDNNTWNSTSSYIELPNSYEEEDNGTGIAWAGLFWQGRVSWDDDHPLRYGIDPFNGENYIRTDGGSFDIESSNANKILLKINNKDYKNVEANKLAYYTYSNGTTYAAYADVTKILQEAKLKKGKNSFQIANLLTNEGRENSPGIFGGWSLVVIYKEDLSGRVRNINSYFGFRDIYQDTPIKISGLRLPKSGAVSSKAALFSGEGEYLYGKQPYDRRSYDWIKISNHQNYNYQYMPDANGNPLPSDTSVGNRDNIFDAHLSGVKRDHIDEKYNDLQTNNDGVDVDIFDLSNIMKDYRDDDPNIDTIYLKMLSNNDYVTPSMLTFATELYTPQICYDYDIRLGDYINVHSKDRNFTVDNVFNEPLQIKIMIRSKEADFNLLNSSLYLTFNPDDVFIYKEGSSKYSPPNVYEFLPAIEVNTIKGEIAVGSDANSSGGIIGANESTYAKFYYDFNKSIFEGKFDVNLNAKISFDGSNKIPYTLSTSAPEDSPFYIPRCPTNPTYDPIYGIINIERGDSTFSQPENIRYPLYTQVVGVPYQISIASYDPNNLHHRKRLNAILEVELINAGTFENNSSAGYDSICQDPDTYHGGAFVDLHNEYRKKLDVPYDGYPSNLALEAASFRAWLLMDPKSGKLAKYPQERYPSNDDYFKKLYRDNYEDDSNEYCKTPCTTDTSNNECYKCLRKYYGKPICSRDIFAIRPKSYSIEVVDTNESFNESNKIILGSNKDTTFKDISAGYAYKLDINATSHNSTSSVLGYYFSNKKYQNITQKAMANYLYSGFRCTDTQDKLLDIVLSNGKTFGLGDITNSLIVPITNGLVINNAGKYEVQLLDKEWTKVDQLGYPYKPYPNTADCLSNSTAAYPDNKLAKRGCLIATGSTRDSLNNLKVISHPYKFDVMSIKVENKPDSNSKFLYISDIEDTRNSLVTNKLMALSINGKIIAKGKNESLLTNYINGCMAQDTNITIAYKTDQNGTLKNNLGNDIALKYYLYNENIDFMLPNTTTINSVRKEGNITFILNKRYFDTNGTANYSQYINFERDYNIPINPFKFTISDFNISGINDQVIADLKTPYTPFGLKDLNVSTIFYYAKVKSKSDFYDDVSENEVKTPIEITVFCGKSLDYCKKYAIDINKSNTNEYDWWINIKHDVNNSEKVYLQSDNINVSVLPSPISNFVKGIDENVTVKANNALLKPATVEIKPTNYMINNYPYLLFNKLSNTPPSFIYKVRFVSPSAAWSGEGKTGHTIKENSSGKKTNRIDW